MRTAKNYPAKYKIEVDFGPFIKGCEMIVQVPEDSDIEETIDSYLDAILNEDLKYNVQYNILSRCY